jgi:hypothetical protein
MRTSRIVALIVGACWCAAAWSAEPLAYWPMETLTNGVAADLSGNGHDAVAAGLDGKLPEVVPGIAGNCLHFTAASQQYLEVRQSEPLQAPAAMTVMAWIKPVASGGTYEILGNKADTGGGSSPPLGWRLRYLWSRAAFLFGAADSTELGVYSPEWSVPAGFWSHVALTYDGRKLALYVDCELLGEQEVAAPVQAFARPLILGNYSGRKDAYAFDGLMDEVKVFATVLSPEEIYAEAAKGMSP